MRISIDWISICLPYKTIISPNPLTGNFEVQGFLRDEFPQLFDFIFSYNDIKQTGGNRIFNRGYHSKIGGFSIFQNDKLPFSLIEFTGTGCKNLHEIDKTKAMAYNHREFLTRLDFAADFETDVTPSTFAAARTVGRFTSYADIKSETGETFYVGSRTSDRFCRVYRYNPPHPRSQFLRVEFQLKKDNAKLVAASLRSNKTKEIVLDLFRTFQFNHEIIPYDGRQQKTPTPIRASRMGKTERWLFKQVAPAIEKLVDDGSTEIVEIFLKKMYNKLSERLIKEEVANDTHSISDWITDNPHSSAEHLPSHQQIP